MLRPFSFGGDTSPAHALPGGFSNVPGDDVSGDGRVLNRDQATALATKLLRLVQEPSIGVLIEHNVRAVTKVANGRVLATNDGDELGIQFFSRFGSGLPVTVCANQLDDTLLRRVVDVATQMAPPKAAHPDRIPEDPEDWAHYQYNKREYVPVSLWHDTTVSAMETARGTMLPQLIETLDASMLVGAATVGLAARSTFYMYKHGLNAWSQETDAEVTVTARTPDGKASGWSGMANRDWSRIDATVVARDAIDLAHKSKNSVALEPGRRTAILGPAAVAQLVRLMARMFDARDTDGGSTPFSAKSGSLPSKLGQRVMDPRLQMVSDPADPLGGYPPFFEVGLWGYTPAGFPNPSRTWIENGVLKNLAYDTGYGMKQGKIPCGCPYSIRVSPMSGAQTATIEEMIANCAEGVYVNRFSDVSLVDFQSGLMTGVTRDGCFLVKHGKIERPIKNFRFTESPFFAFNKLEAIGVAQRAAFGYTPPDREEQNVSYTEPPMGYGTRWPRLPIIVPPMMIQDFNFTALSDSV